MQPHTAQTRCPKPPHTAQIVEQNPLPFSRKRAREDDIGDDVPFPSYKKPSVETATFAPVFVSKGREEGGVTRLAETSKGGGVGGGKGGGGGGADFESSPDGASLAQRWGAYAQYNAVLRECHFLRVDRRFDASAGE